MRSLLFQENGDGTITMTFTDGDDINTMILTMDFDDMAKMTEDNADTQMIQQIAGAMVEIPEDAEMLS